MVGRSQTKGVLLERRSGGERTGERSHTRAQFPGLCGHPRGPLEASNLPIPNHVPRFDLKISGLILAICFALFARTVVFAQTAPSATTTLTTNSIFVKNCAKCHGKTATGRHFGGPSLLSEKTADMSADDLHNIITNGKGHMPKYASKLTSEEVGTLVQQIKALNAAFRSTSAVEGNGLEVPLPGGDHSHRWAVHGFVP
jgi:mono/diheme cytochrome c family protein